MPQKHVSANYNISDADSGVGLPKQNRRRSRLRQRISFNKQKYPSASPCGSSTNVLAIRLEGRIEFDLINFVQIRTHISK